VTHTMSVAGSSPGLLDHRAPGPRAVAHSQQVGNATVQLPMTPSVHASQEEKGNDRSPANRVSA